MTRRSRTALRRGLTFVAAMLAPWLLWPSLARADEEDDRAANAVDFDWRRSERKYESPQWWAFELRFGSYHPKVDEEFRGRAEPYRQVFGDGGRLYFGLEVDFQALRIPYFGTLGPGVSWGFTRMGSKAMLTGQNVPSAEDTNLWIMPMYAVAVLRFDMLANEIGVPVVPFGKVGLGYALWRASNELGTSSYQGVDGKGHSLGAHLAGGAALQLDALDRSSAKKLDGQFGINHSYGFFEWMWSDLGGLGSGQMHVGTSTWVLGLGLEI
jgi:hypothetical protein